MKLQDYLCDVESCRGVSSINENGSAHKYKEVVGIINNHPNLVVLENNLFESMSYVLPFVPSAMSFSHFSFNEFLKMNNYFNDDAMLAFGISNLFTKDFASRIDKSLDNKYHNLEILSSEIKPKLDVLGMTHKYEREMNRFFKNLGDKNIDCVDISWFNSLNLVPVLYSKSDYEFHAKEARKVANSNFAVEIQRYQLDSLVVSPKHL